MKDEAVSLLRRALEVCKLEGITFDQVFLISDPYRYVIPDRVRDDVKVAVKVEEIKSILQHI